MSCLVISNKRIRKSTVKFDPILVKDSKKHKSPKKKIPTPTCQFKLIPAPTKYTKNEILLLYGNIPIMSKNDSFVMDLSFLNELHIYSKVEVKSFQNQRFLSISTERRTDARFSRWRTIVKKITESTSDSIQLAWSQTIKAFSLAYETHMKESCIQTHSQFVLANDSDQHLKNFALERDQRNKKKHELLAKYPYIRLHTCFRGYENRLAEIIINEKLLQTLGYSVDSFTVMALREGLPPIFDSHSNNNSKFLHDMLQNYSTTKNYDSHTPQHQVTLLTRSGYAKSVTIEVHFMMNREEEENYGSDTIFVITDQDTCSSPVRPIQYPRKEHINSEFIEIMSQKEQSMCEFLWRFYRYCLLPEYMNLHRVCLIKELGNSNII